MFTVSLHTALDTVLTLRHDADTINLYQKCTIRKETGRNGSCRRRKNNRRVRFTRSALREALIDLILEKPLVSITVKDICARADINRSTFYLHFKDVTDILRTTEDEIIEHMREHAPMHERECRELQEIKGFFIDFLEQIRNNPRIMKVIQVLCSEQG